jgi:hypothetical protein
VGQTVQPGVGVEIQSEHGGNPSGGIQDGRVGGDPRTPAVGINIGIDHRFPRESALQRRHQARIGFTHHGAFLAGAFEAAVAIVVGFRIHEQHTLAGGVVSQRINVRNQRIERQPALLGLDQLQVDGIVDLGFGRDLIMSETLHFRGVGRAPGSQLFGQPFLFAQFRQVHGKRASDQQGGQGDPDGNRDPQTLVSAQPEVEATKGGNTGQAEELKVERDHGQSPSGQ